MSIILNVLLGAGLAAINAGIIYLSKSQPLKFNGKKFTRTIGVAALTALAIGFVPNITLETLAVIAVYGGFLLEKLYLLVTRRVKDGTLTINIKKG